MSLEAAPPPASEPAVAPMDMSEPAPVEAHARPSQPPLPPLNTSATTDHGATATTTGDAPEPTSLTCHEAPFQDPGNTESSPHLPRAKNSGSPPTVGNAPEPQYAKPSTGFPGPKLNGNGAGGNERHARSPVPSRGNGTTWQPAQGAPGSPAQGSPRPSILRKTPRPTATSAPPAVSNNLFGMGDSPLDMLLRAAEVERDAQMNGGNGGANNAMNANRKRMRPKDEPNTTAEDDAEKERRAKKRKVIEPRPRPVKKEDRTNNGADDEDKKESDDKDNSQEEDEEETPVVAKRRGRGDDAQSTFNKLARMDATLETVTKAGGLEELMNEVEEFNKTNNQCQTMLRNLREIVIVNTEAFRVMVPGSDAEHKNAVQLIEDNLHKYRAAGNLLQQLQGRMTGAEGLLVKHKAKLEDAVRKARAVGTTPLTVAAAPAAPSAAAAAAAVAVAAAVSASSPTAEAPAPVPEAPANEEPAPTSMVEG